MTDETRPLCSWTKAEHDCFYIAHKPFCDGPAAPSASDAGGQGKEHHEFGVTWLHSARAPNPKSGLRSSGKSQGARKEEGFSKITAGPALEPKPSAGEQLHFK